MLLFNPYKNFENKISARTYMGRISTMKGLENDTIIYCININLLDISL